MNKSLVIIYSNIGIGGMPVRIIDLVNMVGKERPKTRVYLLLKERRDFDLRSRIQNPSLTIRAFYKTSCFDSGVLFMLWAWYQIFILNPTTILAFISPYAITALATRFLFFWRKPTIIVNEGHFTSSMIKTMAFPSLQKLGIRLLYPRADAIIAPTNAIKRDLHHSFAVPLKTIHVVLNWSRYAREKIGDTHRPYDIIYCGRFEKEKNILPLLGICKHIISTSIPSLSCVLVGDGSLKAECLRYIYDNALSENIFIKNPTIHISSLIKKTKIYVCNSDKNTEGFPVSVLDAMSLGTLVISRRFEGIEDVLDNTRAFIADSDKQLSQSITQALFSYKDQTALIRRAKQQVEQNHSVQNALFYIDRFAL